MQVPIHELKAQLSRCVARAHAGEVIVITSHSKPVARLTGVPAAAPSTTAVGRSITTRPR